MGLKCREEMSDYSFLKLLLSCNILNYQENIINKDRLEKDLFYLSCQRKYHIFFKHLIARQFSDICYIDLSNAFLTAYRYGLIAIIDEKCEDLKCLIKISEKDTRDNLEKYDSTEINTMNELLLQLKEMQEPEYRVYTVGHISPTEKKLNKKRIVAYIR